MKEWRIFFNMIAGLINLTPVKECDYLNNPENNSVNCDEIVKDKNLDSVTISERWKLSGDRFSAYVQFSGEYNLSLMIESMFQEFYSGNITVEDIREEFDSTVRKIQSFDVEQGIASSDDAEHYGKILSDVLRSFKQHSVSAANTINRREGKAISNQYGDGPSRNFLYYNSNYYYMSEDINNYTLDHAKNIADNAGTVLNTEKSKYINQDIYENFNTFWDRYTQLELRLGNMIDLELKPPKDFTIFYKENRYSNIEKRSMGSCFLNTNIFNGILKVSYGNWNIESDVHLKYSRSALAGKSAFELLSNFTSRDVDDITIQFLKNINIHRAFYGF
jgi:hypothetical protein